MFKEREREKETKTEKEIDRDCITSYSSNHSMNFAASSLNNCKSMVVHMHLFNCFCEGSHCGPSNIYFSPLGVDELMNPFNGQRDLIEQLMEHLGCWCGGRGQVGG